MSRQLQLALAVGLTVVSVALYVYVALAVPRFLAVLSQLGGERPPITQFVSIAYPYFGVLVLPGIVASLGLTTTSESNSPSRTRWFVLACISFGISVLVVIITIASMYLPI
jgi:hypothetical protein